jgi:aldehyde:ferredoxin oxidoreductase
MHGWFGQYRIVDVGDGSSELRPLGRELLRDHIGGVGLGTALLARCSPARVDPLAPEAAIVLAFGPLVGTPITTSAKVAVLAKSPLTDRLTDALTSSDLALAGKRAGVDAIVLVGKARVPSVVLIDEDGARVVPCPSLWGTSRSACAIEAELGERFAGYAFCLIGAAGERMVRYAGLSNGNRHAGRGGLGAVLGSKLVKAIGVRGTRPVPLYDAARVIDIARDLAKRSLGPATEKYRELGTVANLAAFNRLAVLPTRNFTSSTFEGAESLAGETLHQTRARGRGSCKSCTIGCEHFFARENESAVKLEYESLFALGPLCGIGDADSVIAAARRCDELGLDTISAGATIAFAMECNERGLFAATPWRDQAAPLRFGAASAVLAALDAISARSGIGELLADGTRRAAARIGPPAPDFAPHVKGLEIPGYEPRALQTMALGFAVGSRGADHNKSGAYEVDFSTNIDRFAPGIEAASLAKHSEDRAALFDSLILCKFLRGVFDDFHSEAAELMRATTGVEYSGPNLQRAAERIVLSKKLFNVREGWTRAEDGLPKRFLSEGLPSGAAKGALIDAERLQRLITAYYRARGWRDDGSVPRELAIAAAVDAPLVGG